MSIAYLWETAWKYIDLERLCQGVVANVIPSVTKDVANVRSFPKVGKIPAQEEPFPAENPTNFVLTTFCTILKSFFLWPPKGWLTTLRKVRWVANWTRTAGVFPCHWFKERCCCARRRRLSKPFDVSTHAEEKVCSALAQGRWLGNPRPQPLIPWCDPGLSNILSNVCLCSHPYFACVPFIGSSVN